MFTRTSFIRYQFRPQSPFVPLKNANALPALATQCKSKHISDLHHRVSCTCRTLRRGAVGVCRLDNNGILINSNGPWIRRRMNHISRFFSSSPVVITVFALRVFHCTRRRRSRRLMRRSCFRLVRCTNTGDFTRSGRTVPNGIAARCTGCYCYRQRPPPPNEGFN